MSKGRHKMFRRRRRRKVRKPPHLSEHKEHGRVTPLATKPGWEK